MSVTAPALLLVTAVFFIFAVRGRIGRAEGAVLLALYFTVIIVEYVMRT
jgi:Ca2+/Na+ antiporter